MLSKNKLKSKIKPMVKKDHFEVLLENMNDNIKLVAEGQVAFRDEINQRFTDFQQETRDNFKTVFGYLSRIDNELQDIKNSLKRLDETKLDKGEFDDLAKRVARLERELEEYKGSLGAKK
jgi:DNA repair ATPase RecN